ncbi:hypothetical protein KCP69_18170 [Salmonella enterica subsp. enterica]|nr:hypothetical protein KCP69_18170 [Salmonella enterica subsp. enterica]
MDNSALIKQINNCCSKAALWRRSRSCACVGRLWRVEEMLGATLSLHGWRLRGDQRCITAGVKSLPMRASGRQRLYSLASCVAAAPGVLLMTAR